MADDVTFQPTVATPASGTVVATDDVAGKHFQKIKLVDGTADSTTAAKVTGQGALEVAGDTAHDAPDTGLPVKIGGVAADDASATLVADGDRVDAKFTPYGQMIVSTGLALAGEDAVDNAAGMGLWQEDGSIGQVSTRPSVFNGTTWDRQRGSAADGTLVNLGANNDVTVTGTVTANLAAGSNNIGDVDVLSIAAGDNNIGNVDVVTLPALVAGSANIGDVDVLTVPSPLSTAGNGTAATAHRVTLASDSTGQVAIASIAAGTTNIGDVDVLTVPSPLSTAGNGTAATAHRVTLASDSTGQVAVASLPALVAGTANIGDVDVLTVPSPLSTAGNGTAATAHRVTIANDSTGIVTNQPQKAATSSVTSVASSASNVTLLASNAARLGATIYNDSTQNLFAKLGATASSSSFTVKMAAGSYYEVPFGYSGIIDGIWASANGSARLTEVSA